MAAYFDKATNPALQALRLDTIIGLPYTTIIISSIKEPYQSGDVPMLIKSISATTLVQWLDRGEAVVVDVREPAEYAAANIKGAILLPLGQVSKSALPAYSDKKLVIHCHSGTRSSHACAKLLAEDPNLDIYNLEGGISAWAEVGYAVCCRA